jgi:hypothetical protein
VVLDLEIMVHLLLLEDLILVMVQVDIQLLVDQE